MKKILFALSVLSLFTFMSCQPVTSGTGNDDSQVSKWGSLEAKALYNACLGSWKEINHYDFSEFDTVILANDSVTLGTIKYTINQDTDLIKSQDYDGPVCEYNEYFKEGDYIGQIYLKLSDRLLSFEKDNYGDLFIACNLYKDYRRSSFQIISNSGSEGDTSSVNGTYSFNNATGTQKNGSITLSAGNWTYSGSKTNAPSGGTYTVSGADITFSWTANGYSVSTTVTVSKSGSSVTLSSSEVVFFSTFFNSTAQSDGKYSLTFNYSE